MKISCSARKFKHQKTRPRSSESIKTILKHLNAHPETISELQNEPNSHFQNLDFWTFPRTLLRVAPGWHTSRKPTLIKNIFWTLRYMYIARKICQGSKNVVRNSYRLSNSHTSVIYIYPYTQWDRLFSRPSMRLLFNGKRLRRENFTWKNQFSRSNFDFFFRFLKKIRIFFRSRKNDFFRSWKKKLGITSM